MVTSLLTTKLYIPLARGGLVLRARSTSIVVIVSLVAIAGLALSGCASARTTTGLETPVNKPAPALVPITVYKLPGCDCCSQHVAYLEGAGFQVSATYIMYDDSIREKYPVPVAMRSCHIIVVDGYFVEGHMPVEAIMKLLNEKPAIDGIVLPGMPAGSPGMPGQQEKPFTIYALSQGKISEFLTIEIK